MNCEEPCKTIGTRKGFLRIFFLRLGIPPGRTKTRWKKKTILTKTFIRGIFNDNYNENLPPVTVSI